MGHSRGSPERKIYHDTSLSQETKKSQIHNLTLHLKELEKEQQRKPKPRKRRELIKIRTEVNEIETNKQTNKQKTNRTNQQN